MKISLRFFGIVFLAFFFSACLFRSNYVEPDHLPEKEAQDTSSTPEEQRLLEQIEESRKKREDMKKAKTATFSLRKTEENGDDITVELWLDNPRKQSIASVRAWIAFDASVLHVEDILFPEESRFSVLAPGEVGPDEESELIRIGVSTEDGKAVNDEGLLVAHILLKRKTNTATALDFYGFGTAGKTVVLEKTPEGTFRDILLPPAIPSLFLSPLP
ncbi:hypothetical protein IPN35_04460 [Candidatus Peregrinibacteria bacterium]|nr:MAG: hypothetical protein IPN35_04460 [Candidatus Peregrinibacteria bacterium]